MIKNGLKKIKSDHRQLSFHRTFGNIGVLDLPADFNVDAGYGVPDQNAEGYPFGCTGYTQSELCQDEDLEKYQPEYTYNKTRLMEGVVGQQMGCDIRDSLKSLQLYGVKKAGETDEQSVARKRGKYFDVLDGTNLDAFDSIRSAMWVNRGERRAVSAGTPWFNTFLFPENGIMKPPRFYNPDLEGASWHNWKICGWKTINGSPYLVGKPWVGTNWGDKGFCYFPREIVNSLFAIKFTGAFTIRKFTPADAQTVQLSALATIISYLRMIVVNLLKKK